MVDEDGFTLVETVMVTMIVGIILSAVAGSLYLLYSTLVSTTERLSESPDLQIAAAYFGSDVQSASAFASSCGDPLAPGDTRLAGFSWTDPNDLVATDDDEARSVSYVLTATGAQKTLARYSCVGSAATDEVTVVHYLSPTTTPALECADTLGVMQGSCDPTSTASVRLPMTVCTATAAGTCNDDPFTFELKATRRSSS